MISAHIQINLLGSLALVILMPRWRKQQQQQQWGGEEAQPELTSINDHRQPGSLLRYLPPSHGRGRWSRCRRRRTRLRPRSGSAAWIKGVWTWDPPSRGRYFPDPPCHSAASAWFSRSRRSLRVRRAITTPTPLLLSRIRSVPYQTSLS